MSARNVLQSPSLFRQASFVKEKALEKMSSLGLKKTSAPVGREANLLTKEELPVMMENVKVLILHVRARFLMEKEKVANDKLTEAEAASRLRIFDLPGEEPPSPAKVIADARFIRTVAESGPKNLHTALNKFTIQSIGAVIKLVFQSVEAPLIKAEICAEIFSLQDNATKNKSQVDVDDLRAVLGKASARNIDILGQLIALLSLDPSGARRLAYMWGVNIFLPRFDIKNQAAKEYDGFDFQRQTININLVTQMMIEQCMDVFGLDDEEYIKKLAQELKEAQLSELKAAALEFGRTKTPAPSVHPIKPPKARVEKQRPIGMCRILYEFTAEGKLEISVPEGTEVYIIEKGDDEWWKVRMVDDGREGLVPETYVEEVEWDGVWNEEEQEQEKEVEEKEDTENNSMTMQQAPSRSKQPAAPEEEPADDEIEDQIVQLQRKLNALQKKKQLKSRTSSQESVDSVEGGNPVNRSNIASKAFDESPAPRMPSSAPPTRVPSGIKSPPPPMPTTLAPPMKSPAPPAGFRLPAMPSPAPTAGFKSPMKVAPPPVPMKAEAPSAPTENHKSTANPPALPSRVPKSSPPVKTIPKPVSSVNVNSDEPRPQLDLSAIMAKRLSKIQSESA